MVGYILERVGSMCNTRCVHTLRCMIIVSKIRLVVVDIDLVGGVETLRKGLKSGVDKVPARVENIHGHRTLKAPHPVRSAKLTRVPPS